MSRIHIVNQSVVFMDTDAIVNAANRSLLGGGGVDGAIHSAAGHRLFEECKTLGGCNTGDAKITKGYNLKARHVIHTVGPVYYGRAEDAKLLESCYRRCMEVAKENKLKSISFCCISTGVYGYPLDQATEIALKTVTKWLKDNSDYDIEVYFCCYRTREFETYKAIFKEFPEACQQ